MADNELVGRDESSKSKRNPWRFLSPIILLAIGYVLFLLYQAVYFNYQTSQKISALKQDLARLNEQKRELETLITYYQTGSFQELEARKKLGMKMPGEKVVKVELAETSQKRKQDALESADNERPNWEQWLKYLQGEEM